jgi:iron complex transport system ATP-binding protein
MLEAQALDIQYDGKTVINNFSLSVQQGEMISIIGPNGSGKSTVLKAMSRLIPCHMGKVCLEGQDVRAMDTKTISQMMCILCQANQAPSDMTVQELVSYGRMPHKKWYQRLTPEDYEIIEWAIEKTGLSELRHRKLPALSGGEAQRAWIAMALTQRPKVLLLDEPTTFLDIAHQLEVLELTRTINQELGVTVIMVLHDLNHASEYSDKICVLRKGKQELFGTPREVLTTDTIRQIYHVEAEVAYSPVSGKPRIHVCSRAEASMLWMAN